MIIELLIALVKAISRSKKRNRVRYVNSHRQVQLATGVPHGIESRIINLYECAGSNVLSKIKTESLQNFQAPRTLPIGLLDGLSLKFRIGGFLPAFVAGLGKRVEATRKRSIIFVDDVAQALAVTAGEVHHSPDVFAIHDGQKLFGRAQIFTFRGQFHAIFGLRRCRDVGVKIEDRKFSALDS